MKHRLLTPADKLLLRKRPVIETINDQLKNISQIEHTKHRSVTNFLVHSVAFEAPVVIRHPLVPDADGL